jgi:hypothetical protein
VDRQAGWKTLAWISTPRTQQEKKEWLGDFFSFAGQ